MTNEVTIHVRVKDGVSKEMNAIKNTMLGNFGQMTKMLVSYASAAVAAFPVVVHALAPVVLWTGKLLTAAKAAAPALAVFAVQGLFLKATLGQIFAEGSALVKALSPMGKAFTEAGKAASKAAAEGIKPMVDDLIKAGLMDRVAGTMKRIGVEVNKVAFGFLTWAKTEPGARAIGQILNGIDRTVKGLSTPITNLGMSFFEMVGRISDVSAAAGVDGLTSVMNHLAKAMDKVTAASVSKGMKDFAEKLGEIKTFVTQAVDAISAGYHWFKKFEKQINLAADAAGVLGIALGIYLMQPLVVIVSAVSLLIRHFHKLGPAITILKKAFAKGKEIFGPLIQAFEYLGREILPEVIKGFRKIATAVLPVLKRIGKAIQGDLIPALGEFVVAVAPVIRVMVHRLAPIVAAVMKGLAHVVLANIHIAAAAFRNMAAVLRLAVRAYNALRTGATRAMNGLKNAVHNTINSVVTTIRNMKTRIVGVFANAGSWLVNAGKRIIRGLISGIKSVGSGAVKSAVRAVVPDSLEKFIPGLAHGGYVGARAAGGGPRGSRVLVGEQGPEIVDLPLGSHVNSNADSRRIGMAASGGGGGGVHFHFHGPVYGDHNALKRALVNMKRSGDLDLVLR